MASHASPAGSKRARIAADTDLGTPGTPGMPKLGTVSGASMGQAASADQLLGHVLLNASVHLLPPESLSRIAEVVRNHSEHVSEVARDASAAPPASDGCTWRTLQSIVKTLETTRAIASMAPGLGDAHATSQLLALVQAQTPKPSHAVQSRLTVEQDAIKAMLGPDRGFMYGAMFSDDTRWARVALACVMSVSADVSV